MTTHTVAITVNKNGLGYSIAIDRFLLELNKDDEVRWVISSNDPEALISIDPDHKQHFVDLVPGTYGRNHTSRMDPQIKANVRFHYKVCILVDDVDRARTGHYKNVICIDPDYKVVP